MPSPLEICRIAGVAQFVLSVLIICMCFLAPNIMIDYWPEIKFMIISLVRLYNAYTAYRQRRV